MTNLSPLTALKFERFDTPRILKKVASASRARAELKGVVASTGTMMPDLENFVHKDWTLRDGNLLNNTELNHQTNI